MSYNPFVSQDEQDDNSHYFGPQVPHAWDTGICAEQEAEISSEEADYYQRIEDFADFRGLKNGGDIHKLYYAWLKATNPHHEDLDHIGERKLTEAEAQEAAGEAEMEAKQWQEGVQRYEEAGTYMGRG